MLINQSYLTFTQIHLDLIPTLLSLSTIRLSLQTLTTSLTQVSIYLSKFKTRLTADHALHIKRLAIFLDALKKYATEWLALRKSEKSLKERTEIMNVGELMQRLGRKAEGINMLEVEAYLRSSKVLAWSFFLDIWTISLPTDCEKNQRLFRQSGRKGRRWRWVKNILQSKLLFITSWADPAKLAQLRRGATPPLHAVEAFMLSLTAANEGMYRRGYHPNVDLLLNERKRWQS